MSRSRFSRYSSRACARDVRRREPVVEVRGQGLVAVLGDHRPVPVLVEPVDEHPVEAGDPPDLRRREPAQLVDRRPPAGGRGRSGRGGTGSAEAARRSARGSSSRIRTPSIRWAGRGTAVPRPAARCRSSSPARIPSAPRGATRPGPRRRGPPGVAEDLFHLEPEVSRVLPLAWTTAHDGSSTRRRPDGWMLPGMWIGSRSHVARSTPHRRPPRPLPP